MNLLMVWIISIVFGVFGFFAARAGLKDLSFIKTIGPWALLVYGIIATILTVAMGVILTLIFKPGQAKIGTVTSAEDARNREALLVANYGGRLSPKVIEGLKIRANRSTMTWDQLQIEAEYFSTTNWVVQDHAYDGLPLWYIQGMLNWTDAYQWASIRAHEMWYGETNDTKLRPYKDRCYWKNPALNVSVLTDAIKFGYIDTSSYDSTKAQEQIDSKGYWYAGPDYCYVPERNVTWVHGVRQTGRIMAPPK